MIECPWCGNRIEIKNGRCPKCRKQLHEVIEDDFQFERSEDGLGEEMEFISDDYHHEKLSDISIEQVIENKFKCSKCGGTECTIKEVAMTGAGLSKLLDVQYNHFLFVSCISCGFVEIYDPDILQNMKTGSLGTIMDILFGR
ncbi:zinc ribbon domain-containing protein [Paenibacillus lentus]|uniref:zinc ribbon domain-containing protein n=1 Tax=Paenibacillus lentus TaxID=1338368 RepID=UPI003664753E